MIERVINQLVIDEGLKLMPYEDTLGLLTIGIGRCLETRGLSYGEMIYLIYNLEARQKRMPKDINETDPELLFELLVKDMEKYGITREEAFCLCRNDVYNAIADLERTLPWYQNAPGELKEVLINMCFNMGIGNSRKGLLSFRNTLKLMQFGQYKAAADNMLKSKWARQVKRRADRLADRVRNLEK